MSNAPPLLLAVDAGGSGTRAVVVEPDGTCLGLGLGSAGNPTSAGPQEALLGIAGAARAALRQAGQPTSSVAAVLVAMAGSRDLLRPGVLAAALGWTGDPGRLRTVSDILAMYHSGAVEPAGGAVVAGTGSVAARVDAGQVVRVFGGSGWLLGDGGSGFAIGHRVVRAVVAELDGVAPETALSNLLLTELGIQRDGRLERGRCAALDRLMDVLYRQRPVVLARYAPLAFDAADDPVAAAIVEQAQDEIAALVAAVRSAGPPGPLVLGGSVLHHGVLAPGRARSAALMRELDGADVRQSRDGAVGAAVAGLAWSGHPVTEAVLERLGRSVVQMRDAVSTDAESGRIDTEQVRRR